MFTAIFINICVIVLWQAANTFILALDGDVDFKPDAVRLLVDLLKKNKKVGAACGRIHPIGRGQYTPSLPADDTNTSLQLRLLLLHSFH